MTAFIPVARRIAVPFTTVPLTASFFIASLPLFPVLLAASQAEVEVWTAVGSFLAMALIYSYMRMKQPQLGFWSVTYNLLATVVVGWVFPEVFMTVLCHARWMTPDTVAGFGRKAWAFWGLLFGIGGATIITAIMLTVQRRIPTAVETLAEHVIPGTHPGENLHVKIDQILTPPALPSAPPAPPAGKAVKELCPPDPGAGI